VEAELTKAEIRELSRRAGLPTWDRPAAACLSSRIPYGTPVTIQNIKTVEVGEEEMKALGFRQFRTAFTENWVRIEVARKELPKALNLETAGKLTKIFKALGFKYADPGSGRVQAGFPQRGSATQRHIAHSVSRVMNLRSDHMRNIARAAPPSPVVTAIYCFPPIANDTGCPCTEVPKRVFQSSAPS